MLLCAGVTKVDPSICVEERVWDEHSVLHNIAVFNDDPVRTQSEVVEQLQRRAQLLRQLQDV